MRNKCDRDYYAERLQAERMAAEAATCDEAREAHLALAETYAQLLADGPAAKEAPGRGSELPIRITPLA